MPYRWIEGIKEGDSVVVLAYTGRIYKALVLSVSPTQVVTKRTDSPNGTRVFETGAGICISSDADHWFRILELTPEYSLILASVNTYWQRRFHCSQEEVSKWMSEMDSDIKGE